MAFDFTTLVTDRTAADVAARNEKGTYNATDLNRVDAACADLAEQLRSCGYAVAVSTRSEAWTMEDIPTPEEMDTYLRNVRSIREVLSLAASVPGVPGSMRRLTHEEANDIERVLEAVSAALERLRVVLPRAGQPLLHCGCALYLAHPG